MDFSGFQSPFTKFRGFNQQDKIPTSKEIYKLKKSKKSERIEKKCKSISTTLDKLRLPTVEKSQNQPNLWTAFKIKFISSMTSLNLLKFFVLILTGASVDVLEDISMCSKVTKKQNELDLHKGNARIRKTLFSSMLLLIPDDDITSFSVEVQVRHPAVLWSILVTNHESVDAISAILAMDAWRSLTARSKKDLLNKLKDIGNQYRTLQSAKQTPKKSTVRHLFIQFLQRSSTHVPEMGMLIRDIIKGKHGFMGIVNLIKTHLRTYNAVSTPKGKVSVPELSALEKKKAFEGKKPNVFRGKCNNCGKRGHKAKDCHYSGKCSHCGKTGHMAEYCRKKKRDLNQRNSNDRKEGNMIQAIEPPSKKRRIYIHKLPPNDIKITNSGASRRIYNIEEANLHCKEVIDLSANDSDEKKANVSLDEKCGEVSGVIDDEDKCAEYTEDDDLFEPSVSMIADFNANGENTIIVDGGANNHYFNNKSYFINLERIEPFRTQIAQKGSGFNVEHKGTVLIETKYCILKLDEVYYSPKFPRNYISTGVLDEIHGFAEHTFNGLMILSKNGKPVISARRRNRLYFVEHVVPGSADKESPSLNSITFPVIDSLPDMHRRYGHISYQALKRTARVSRVHSDVKTLPLSVRKYRYFVVFVREGSSYIQVALLRKKTEVLKAAKSYFATAKSVQGARVIEFRSDGGGEYYSRDLLDYLQQEGIKFTPSSPYTPPRYWCFAVAQAAYILNRTVRKGKTKTPEELYTGNAPDVSTLVPFGCIGTRHIPRHGNYIVMTASTRITIQFLSILHSIELDKHVKEI